MKIFKSAVVFLLRPPFNFGRYPLWKILMWSALQTCMIDKFFGQRCVTVLHLCDYSCWMITKMRHRLGDLRCYLSFQKKILPTSYRLQTKIITILLRCSSFCWDLFCAKKSTLLPVHQDPRTWKWLTYNNMESSK